MSGQKVELRISQANHELLISVKPARGVHVFQETRKNHLPCKDGHGNVIEDAEYVVIQISDSVIPWEDLYAGIRSVAAKECFATGFQMRHIDGGFEISGYERNPFIYPILSSLKRMRLIRSVSFKEDPYYKGEFPIYVNAHGLQVLYNMVSLIARGFYLLFHPKERGVLS